MKQSNYSFAEGFLNPKGQIARQQGQPQMKFDWDKAAQIIKEKLQNHPDLMAEAGLQSDWCNTGGCIFVNGEPDSDSYTFLSSNWAIPTLILSWNDKEQEEIECFTVDKESRFDSDSKWDEISLNILNSK